VSASGGRGGGGLGGGGVIGIITEKGRTTLNKILEEQGLQMN